MSFNEYLSLMSNKDQEPSEDALMECFEIFDTNKNGKIPEHIFRKIMTGKLGAENEFEIEVRYSIYSYSNCLSTTV